LDFELTSFIKNECSPSVKCRQITKQKIPTSTDFTQPYLGFKLKEVY